MQIKINLMPYMIILTVIFITLKLVEVITWSWLWVLSPIWIPYTFFFAIFCLMILMGAKITNTKQ